MRILSGIQPSGKLHIGNYFGAMKPMLELQERGEAFYFIADFHSLTSVSDPATLRENVRDVAIDFLSCGLDPEKAVFFRQSDVSEVNELAWILSTVCPMGLLERCHSYKDKTARGFSPNHALFAYPVLMAADILLYDSDVVPVGRDQKQHLEVTRDLAQKINDQYGEGTLKLPEPHIQDATAVIPGLDGQKMSKSYGNTIDPFMDEKPLRKRIMKIVTDSKGVDDVKDPATCTVFQIFAGLAGKDDARTTDLAEQYRKPGMGYGHAKQALFELVLDEFADARAKRTALIDDPGYIDGVLKAGAEAANAQVSVVVKRAREAAGL